jgi:hypothetical protein
VFEEIIMSDRMAGAATAAAELAETTVETYVATWNETDAARRQASLARAWSATGRYRDPIMASDGPAEIDAMLAAVQARFPGFVLKRTSKVDSFVADCGRPGERSGERYARFTWSLGPPLGPTVVEGVDFGTFDPDGKLASIVGFIDKAPTI